MNIVEVVWHQSKVTLKPMVMEAPVERWAIDLAGPFPASSKGHTYILTAMCVFSKFVILVPLCDKFAISVAQPS